MGNYWLRAYCAPFYARIKCFAGQCAGSFAYSRRPETADAFVAQYGGKPCTSAEELLASDIDAIYIATLPITPMPITIKALNAGKPVLCEKPATLNLPQLDEVLTV
jgi:predicted dehydrogenase